MDHASTSRTGSDAIADGLRVVVSRLVRHLRAGYTLPPHHFGAMRSLELGGPQTASALAAAELVRPQSMAHTLQQLADAGYLTRQPDPTDRRQTLVDLSERGLAALLEQRREVTDRLTRTIEDRFDAAERATLAEAVGLLGRLLDG